MEQTTNNNIKIVRLQSGEDIMADVMENDENELIVLDNPMHIIFKRMPTGQTVMMMMPWLPIEIIKDNTALVDVADILTIIDPKDSAIKHYGEVVIEAQKRMDEVDFISESEDGDEEDGEDDDEETSETKDFNVDELLELIKEKKNKRLH